MEKILGLLGKNKKALLKYVEENKLVCFKKRKNVYSFKLLFLNIGHTCEVYIYKKKIYSILLFLNDEKELNISSFNELVNCYKEYFNSNYGNPIRDNTNHPTDNIAIDYEKDSLFISIFGNIHKLQIVFTTCSNEDKIKTHKLNPLLKYMIYLAGGFIWGLIMFLSMSFGDYSWSNFGIWMSGGLVWAILFGVLFELFINKASKQDKINLKHIKKIEEQEKELEYTINSCGQLFIFNNNKSKSYDAKMYFNQGVFTILYYKKGTICKMEEKIDLLSKNLGFGYLAFKSNDESFSFHLSNSEDFSMIKEYIDERLGYHSSRFMEIKSLVKKLILEYNPYSLYRGNNETVFDFESDIISRRIYDEPNISFDDFKELVLIAFDYDSSIQIYEELATILFDSMIRVGDE